MLSKTDEEIQKLLGKQVRVTLDQDVVTSGKLLAFDDGGGFVLLDGEGFKHYCWPMLEIEEDEPANAHEDEQNTSSEGNAHFGEQKQDE